MGKVLSYVTNLRREQARSIMVIRFGRIGSVMVMGGRRWIRSWHVWRCQDVDSRGDSRPAGGYCILSSFRSPERISNVLI